MAVIITLACAVKNLVLLNLCFFKGSNLELIVNHQALGFEIFWCKVISYAELRQYLSCLYLMANLMKSARILMQPI